MKQLNSVYHSMLLRQSVSWFCLKTGATCVPVLGLMGCVFYPKFAHSVCRFVYARRSYVKFKLFCSYCTSFYGFELWSLNSSCIEDLCTAWRKSLPLFWKLPPLTHCYLLPLICRCLPAFGEICRRSLNFIRASVKRESPLVRLLAS